MANSSKRSVFDKSIVNKKFGALLVLDDFKVNEKITKTGKVNKYTTVKCICDCGNEKYVNRNYLYSSKHPNCGCLVENNINLVNQKFGKLTVISQTLSRNGRKAWYCKCDCGSDKITNTKALRTGQTTSCGCIHYSKRNFHKNWRGTENISLTFFTAVKRGAISRNIEFDITIEYIEELFIKQNKKCALSGMDLVFSQVTKNKFGVGNASLDRIDSKKGYITGNLQWVHKTINIMKNTLSQDEFINICLKISKKFYEK